MLRKWIWIDKKHETFRFQFDLILTLYSRLLKTIGTVKYSEYPYSRAWPYSIIIVEYSRYKGVLADITDFI